MKKTLLFFLFLFSISIGFSQHFKDHVAMMNSGLIMKHFNTFEFFPTWLPVWSEATGYIVVDGTASSQVTRKVKKSGNILIIDSAEFNSPGGKYTPIRKMHIEVDLKNKTYHRIDRLDIEGFTDPAADYILKYDKKGRICYAQYSFAPGFTSTPLDQHHYSITYATNGLMDSIIGYDSTGIVKEVFAFRANLNMKDSSLTMTDQNKRIAAKVKKSTDTLWVILYEHREEGLFSHGDGYIVSGNAVKDLYMFYPEESKRDIRMETITTTTANKTSILESRYETYPKVSSKKKVDLTFDPERPQYMRYKEIIDGKLQIEIEQR